MKIQQQQQKKQNCNKEYIPELMSSVSLSARPRKKEVLL